MCICRFICTWICRRFYQKLHLSLAQPRFYVAFATFKYPMIFPITNPGKNKTCQKVQRRRRRRRHHLYVSTPVIVLFPTQSIPLLEIVGSRSAED